MYPAEQITNKTNCQTSLNDFVLKSLSKTTTSISDHPVNRTYKDHNHPDKTARPMQIPRERPEEPMSKYWERFQRTIHSESTRKTYTYYLTAFLKFIDKNHLELVAMDVESRQSALEEWAIYLVDQRYRKTGILTRLAAVEKFLQMNRCEYFRKPIHGLIPNDEYDEIGGCSP